MHPWQAFFSQTGIALLTGPNGLIWSTDWNRVQDKISLELQNHHNFRNGHNHKLADVDKLLAYFWKNQADREHANPVSGPLIEDHQT